MRQIQVAVRTVACPIGTAAENEDNFLVIDGRGNFRCLQDERERSGRVPGWPVGHWRLAVLDGMGGHGRGRVVCEQIVAGLLLLPACHNSESLNRSLESLHHQVQTAFECSTSAPGATLLLLEIPPSGPSWLFHAGDSRLFRLREDCLELLTVDHAPPTAYAMHGMIDEREWMRQILEEKRACLSQAFGLGHSFGLSGVHSRDLFALTSECLPPFLAHLPDRRALALEPGEIYLLVTDGLWSCESPLAFLATLPSASHEVRHDAESLVARLLERHCAALRNRNQRDNATVMVLRIESK